MDIMNEVLNKMPFSIKQELSGFHRNILENAEEIRFHLNYPILVQAGGKKYIRPVERALIIDENILNDTINNLLNYSNYAYATELSNGYITMEGGHRAGFSGRVVMEENHVGSIQNITSIHLRLARDFPGSSDLLYPQLLSKSGRFLSTILVSPPGCGKTTMLRDLIRRLSAEGYNVSVCDERNEITAYHYNGFAFDLGNHVDVMSGCSKGDGMLMLLRSMSPDIIATDEIGLDEDISAIQKSVVSGVRILTTVHGETIEDVLKSRIGRLICSGVFPRVVFLSGTPKKGTVRFVWKKEEEDSK